MFTNDCCTQPMKIHVSQDTAYLLHGSKYIVEERGEVQIKVITHLITVFIDLSPTCEMFSLYVLVLFILLLYYYRV